VFESLSNKRRANCSESSAKLNASPLATKSLEVLPTPRLNRFVSISRETPRFLFRDRSRQSIQLYLGDEPTSRPGRVFPNSTEAFDSVAVTTSVRWLFTSDLRLRLGRLGESRYESYPGHTRSRDHA